MIPSLLYNEYRVFPGGKERPGRDADPSPPSSAVLKKGQSYTSTPCISRTASKEPQCLYKGALYLLEDMIRGSLHLPSESWRPGAEQCFVAGGTVGTTWDPSCHVPMPGTSMLPIPNSCSGCFPVPGTRFPVHLSLWSTRQWALSSVAWSLCPESAPWQRGSDTGTQESGRVASVSYFGGSDMRFILMFRWPCILV